MPHELDPILTEQALADADDLVERLTGRPAPGRPGAELAPMAQRVRGRAAAVAPVLLRDPGFWVGLLLPLLVLGALLGTLVATRSPEAKTALGASAGVIGILLALVPVLGLGERLGVSPAETAEVVGRLAALVKALSSAEQPPAPKHTGKKAAELAPPEPEPEPGWGVTLPEP